MAISLGIYPTFSDKPIWLHWSDPWPICIHMSATSLLLFVVCVLCLTGCFKKMGPLVRRFKLVTGSLSNTALKKCVYWYVCFPTSLPVRIGWLNGFWMLLAFGIHLNSGYKTALWTILMQASLWDRTSAGAWKCLQGCVCLRKSYTQQGITEVMWGQFGVIKHGICLNPQ